MFHFPLVKGIDCTMSSALKRKHRRTQRAITDTDANTQHAVGGVLSLSFAYCCIGFEERQGRMFITRMDQGDIPKGV